MPRTKLTARGIDALLTKPRANRTDHFDIGTPALCLRIGPRSATWYYLPRINGKLTRLALGEYPTISLHDARAAVAKAEADIASGKHPKAEQARERTAKRIAIQIDQERIVKSVGEAWAKHHFPTVGEASRRDYRRALDEFIADFGDRDIGSLRRSEIVRHLDAVRSRPPRRTGKVKARPPTAGTQANRAAVVIRQLFTFARDRFDLDSNPAADIKNPTKQKKKTRTLDRHEIRILWRACERAGYPYGHALRFAMCTGQRIGEVGMIARSDIDSTGEYWKQSKNKSDQRIDIFLDSHAAAILKSCPDFGAKAPFFSNNGKRGIRSDGWYTALRRHIEPVLDLAARELKLPPIIEPWTAHDLRRTVRTALTGWCHVSPDTAERVLNHAITGLRGVYDHADYRPHVTQALQRWDQELTAILKGEHAKVENISTARANRRKIKAS